MFDRRTFLGAVSCSLAAGSISLAAQATERRRLAIVTTEWRYRSHAWHMGERFLVGYLVNGRWHHPPFDVVSAYVDQQPDNDLSQSRSKEFGFPIYGTIAEALRCGGKELAVDAVLVIGEHGDYPRNEIGQKLYPRYEFFREVVNVFREDGRAVPMFNDKHLSWKWAWAKEMADTARELDFGYCAGSSLPVTWRMPAMDMPYGADIEEVMSVLLMNGLVGDFNFAAKLKGRDKPLSTLFYLPPNPNVTYSAALMEKAEETFLTGRAPYPVERTLLTSGLVESGVRSLASGKRVETPYVDVLYEAPRGSTFANA